MIPPIILSILSLAIFVSGFKTGRSVIPVEPKHKIYKVLRLIGGLILLLFVIVSNLGEWFYHNNNLNSAINNYGPLYTFAFYSGYLYGFQPDSLTIGYKFLKVIIHVGFILILGSGNIFLGLILIPILIFIGNIIAKKKDGLVTNLKTRALKDDLDNKIDLSQLNQIVEIKKEFLETSDIHRKKEIIYCVKQWEGNIPNINTVKQILSSPMPILDDIRSFYGAKNDPNYHACSEFVVSKSLFYICNIVKNGNINQMNNKTIEDCINMMDKYDMSPEFRKNTYNPFWNICCKHLNIGII